MNSYTIQLTEGQLDIIGRLLGDAPYRIASPIVDSINQQIRQQQQQLIAQDEPLSGER